MPATPQQKEIRSAYEELKGILNSLGDSSSWFYDNGFSRRANDAIERVANTCPEITNIESYKIKPFHNTAQGAGSIDVVQAKANLNSLMGRIKGLYELDEMPILGGHTFIQNQQMNVEFLLDIRGTIEKQIENYSQGEPERTFLEKVKEHLSSMRTSMDVIRLILTSAGELGVTVEMLRKIFGF